MKGYRVVVLLMFSLLLMMIVPSRISVSNEEAVMNVSSGFPSVPHSANALWLEPSTMDLAEVNVGGRFNLTAWVNVTDPAMTWQTEVFFDPAYFNATRVDYTGEGKSDFFSNQTGIVPVTPMIDNVEGYVLHGETLMTGSETGYGSLIWVEFMLTQMPHGNHLTINFTAADTFLLRYPDMTDILLDTMDGTNITVPTTPEVHLLLVEPKDNEYKKGESVTFTVEVFNQLNPSSESTLTFTVTGPEGYHTSDFQTITVAADNVEEYSFNWNVPEATGTYIIEVGLVPAMLTAYDSVWLEVI